MFRMERRENHNLVRDREIEVRKDVLDLEKRRSGKVR